MRDHHVDPNGQPIADFRALPPYKTSRVTIQGVVTLTYPTLFVQDSTGGVAIQNFNATTPPQIGDQVEATRRCRVARLQFGDERRRRPYFVVACPTLFHGCHRFAGCDRFVDAQYIEIEGYLENKQEGPDHNLVLDLSAENQSFRAIANGTSRRCAISAAQKQKPPALARNLCGGFDIYPRPHAVCHSASFS